MLADLSLLSDEKDGCSAEAAEAVFAECNVQSDPRDPVTKLVNHPAALMRFEFIECIVRLAICHFGNGEVRVQVAVRAACPIAGSGSGSGLYTVFRLLVSSIPTPHPQPTHITTVAKGALSRTRPTEQATHTSPGHRRQTPQALNREPLAQKISEPKLLCSLQAHSP
jgi:hypothetical protein